VREEQIAKSPKGSPAKAAAVDEGVQRTKASQKFVEQYEPDLYKKWGPGGEIDGAARIAAFGQMKPALIGMFADLEEGGQKALRALEQATDAAETSKALDRVAKSLFNYLPPDHAKDALTFLEFLAGSGGHGKPLTLKTLQVVTPSVARARKMAWMPKDVLAEVDRAIKALPRATSNAQKAQLRPLFGLRIYMRTMRDWADVTLAQGQRINRAPTPRYPLERQRWLKNPNDPRFGPFGTAPKAPPSGQSLFRQVESLPGLDKDKSGDTIFHGIWEESKVIAKGRHKGEESFISALKSPEKLAAFEQELRRVALQMLIFFGSIAGARNALSGEEEFRAAG
jgi:hypothetical protein